MVSLSQMCIALVITTISIKYIARFTPSIVKKETSSKEQHKAYVNVDVTHNPFDIIKLTKASGIKF